MKSNRRVILIITSAILCSFVGPAGVNAQTTWLSPDQKPSVSLEIVKPDLYQSGYWDINFPSSAWYLSARLQMTDNIHGLIDAGFVLYDDDYTYGYGMEQIERPSQNAFMNPYLGIEILDPSRHWYVQAGLRLPLVPEDNDMGKQYGLLTDIDRMEAFAEDLLPIKLRVGDRLSQGNLTLHGYMGPSIWFFTGSNGNEDTEAWLDYGGQVWVSADLARVGGGLMGRYWLTADEGNFNERSIHYFCFTTNFGNGRVQPGMQLRVPLDDNMEMTGLKYSWGLYLNVLID
jgi:hypothetical protein